MPKSALPDPLNTQWNCDLLCHCGKEPLEVHNKIARSDAKINPPVLPKVAPRRKFTRLNIENVILPYLPPGLGFSGWVRGSLVAEIPYCQELTWHFGDYGDVAQKSSHISKFRTHSHFLDCGLVLDVLGQFIRLHSCKERRQMWNRWLSSRTIRFTRGKRLTKKEPKEEPKTRRQRQ